MTTGFVTTLGEPTYQGPPEAPPNGAQQLVEQGFETAQDYASSSYNNAIEFLNQLSAAAATIAALPAVNTTLAPLASAIAEFTMPTRPLRPDGLDVVIPEQPGEPTTATVTPLAIGNAPEFTDQPPAVDLNIAKPPALTTTAPTAPTLNTVTIPTAADVVLPEVPTLTAINIPTAPLLDLPVFVAVAPDAPDAPAYIFSFAETRYTSTLLTALRSQYETWITGNPATGLDPSVEMALWERGRQRETIATNRKIGEVTKTFARSGFTKPPGAMGIELSAAIQEQQNTLVGLSREIMIKQADLEQANRKFAFEQAWKIEEKLIEYENLIAQRVFEAAKYAQQIGIDIYRETVNAYSADIRKFATEAEVFKVELQGELAKLEVYKAELEGQRLLGTINEQHVNIYTARVNAAKILVEMFVAEVQAAQAEAMVNKTIIEAFAAEVGAFAETVRAKAAEYDAYATQVKAEVSKIDILTAQATAFNSRVTGFKATVDALVAAKQSEVEVGVKLPIDVFKTRSEVFRTLVQAESSRAEAVSKVYAADAQVFGEEVRGEAARVSSDTEVYKAGTQVTIAEGNLRIEAAKANIQTLVQQITLLVESIKAGAQVAAQLAAASLSAVNLSAQVGDHTGYNVSNSVSNASSDSFVRSYSNSQSTSESTSEVTSTSESTATNTNNTTMTSTVYQYTN